MSSSDGLAPSSSLDHLPPPSPSPSSHLRPTQSTPPSSSSPPRPIPIEIYDLILFFAFGRHRPIPLENRLDEPPSVSHLLPLTLVSKGLRKLVLPYLYHHIVIRREEDWIQLLDPTEGLLIGEGEEQTSRRRWVKKLSFAQGHFPVGRWSTTQDEYRYYVDASMASLDWTGLEQVEEVCVGSWGKKSTLEDEKDWAFIDLQMAGGDFRKNFLEEWGYRGIDELLLRCKMLVLMDLDRRDASSDLLQNIEPSTVHIFATDYRLLFNFNSFEIPPDVVVHPNGSWASNSVEEATRALGELSTRSESSRFILEPCFPSDDEKRERLLKSLGASGWVRDEDGWWTREEL